MKTRQLGKTGIRITEIGLGTNYVGGHNIYASVDEAAGERLVREALEAGITFFDTADVYGDGRCEELLRGALSGMGERIVLATKGGIVPGRAAGDPGRLNSTPAYLRSALQASLQRLGRESVDLYYIHRPDRRTPIEESFGALLRFKEQGLIRAAGLSNVTPVEIRAALGVGPVDAVQGCYNLLQREVEAETLDLCREQGISFIPWGPLAYGLLGGRYSADFKVPAGEWRSGTGLFDPGNFERNLDIVARLKAIAARRGAEPAAVAIQWMLSRPEIASVIAGAKNADQVRRNVRAGELALDPAEVAEVGALSA
ncbi:MAG: aldo/keto reductase [Burkholderiales bacterium]|nr:aldo/keto reductase [Burkholderiales bacterium]